MQFCVQDNNISLYFEKKESIVSVMLSYGKLYKFLYTVSQTEAWHCYNRKFEAVLFNFCSLLFEDRWER